jgi:hypothetical protein
MFYVLQSFWNRARSCVTANVGQHSGLDANTLFASRCGRRPRRGGITAVLGPGAGESARLLRVPRTAQRGRGPQRAVGRYPEDGYYSSNVRALRPAFLLARADPTP